MPRALAAAKRALALDPELPDAAETLIAYDLFYRWDLRSARQRLDSAIARYPDHPEFHNLLATWYRFSGELATSLEIKQQNVERDPLSPRYAYQIAESFYYAHRCAEAENAYRRLPGEIRATRGSVRLYTSLTCQGKYDEAAVALREAALQAGDTLSARMLEPPLAPENRALAVESVFRRRLGQELARRREEWSPPERVMLQYAQMQNADSTLVWLDSMYAERSMMLYVVPFDPLNDFMRDDPRFQAFVDRLIRLRAETVALAP
jgi:tetratricopeptide (TPR) repeat protein